MTTKNNEAVFDYGTETFEIDLAVDTVRVSVMNGGYCEVVVNNDNDRAFSCSWRDLVDGLHNDDLVRRDLTTGGVDRVVACLRNHEDTYWASKAK